MKHNLLLSLFWLSLTSIVSLFPVAISAQDYYKNYDEEYFMDLDFDRNLELPEVPSKLSSSIQKEIRKTAENYQGIGSNVDLMRNGEVMIVTIPTDRLFLPNDTILSSDASSLLNPLLKPITDPFLFKLVIAVHTDDTGSDFYRNELSTARLNSIYDWFINKIDAGEIDESLVIIPFAMGSEMPITDNDSRKHRSENRRLEVYYIPGPKMLEMASKGLLK